VLGAVLIIVGGTPASKWGSELVLGTFPFRWIGALLLVVPWSWPILTLMVESSTKALTTPQRLVSVVLALGASAATYFAIENPVRHSRVLAKSSWRSIAVGAIIVAAVLTVATIEIHTTRPSRALRNVIDKLLSMPRRAGRSCDTEMTEEGLHLDA